MKSLFDYATKELSQDAFLRWLFETWKEIPECGVIVRKMLKKFCGFEAEIKDITTKAQEKNIDITVEITPHEGKKIYLFIEDKTFSSEHKQLTKYDEYINTIANAYKVFYKTNKINDDDKRGIDKANEINEKNNKKGWQQCGIDEIIDLFDGDYQNLILKHYIVHIKEIYEALNTTVRPEKHESKMDLLKWEGYFNNSIKPRLRKNGYEVGVWRAGPYPYICLVIRMKEKQPYLEITSKDCMGDNFIAKILLYGVDEKKEQEIARLKENIETSSFCLQVKRKKTIGKTPQNDKVKDEGEFIEKVEKYAQEFLRIMKDWK